MLRHARPVLYPLALLVGSSLVVAAGLAHPDLTGDGAAQLGVIARTEAWRAIHWAFLFGFVLTLTGLAGFVGVHAGTPGGGAARAGMLVAIFAYGAWAVVVTFMVGAGWTLAQSYVAAQPGLTATHAVFLYRSEEHTSELQSQSNLVCRLLLEKKKTRHVGYVYDHVVSVRL